MINNVTLVGRLTYDPDLRYTVNGTAVASFSLAVNRKRKNQDGERGVDFIPCVAWSKAAETIAEYAKKGKELAVEGELRQNSWENEDGERRSRIEVHITSFQFLRDPNGSKADDEEEEIEEEAEEKPKKKKATKKGSKKKKEARDPFEIDEEPLEIDEDDIPF